LKRGVFRIQTIAKNSYLNGIEVRWSGSSFQTRAAGTRKVRSPTDSQEPCTTDDLHVMMMTLSKDDLEPRDIKTVRTQPAYPYSHTSTKVQLTDFNRQRLVYRFRNHRVHNTMSNKSNWLNLSELSNEHETQLPRDLGTFPSGFH